MKAKCVSEERYIRITRYMYGERGGHREQHNERDLKKIKHLINFVYI